MWKPSNNPFAPDRWYRKYNEKVCYNWDHYPNARRTKGFIGYLKFGDLEVREKEEYLAIKRRKKEEIKKLEEMEEKKEEILKKRSLVLGKTMMLSLLRDNNLLVRGALSAVAELEGTTKQMINQRLKTFKEKYEEEIGNVNLVNDDTSYNTKGNRTDFPPIKTDTAT
jgi:hypothetical protein